MTRDLASARFRQRGRLQQWRLALTAFVGVGTTGMEGAACRRIEWIWHFAAGKADLLQKRDDLGRQCRWRLGESVSADRLGDDVLDPPPRIEARVGILKDHLHGPPQRKLRIGKVDKAAGVADFAARGAVQ